MVCFASLGGSGRVAVELSRQLVRRGVQAWLVAQEPPPAFDPDDGVQFVPIQVPKYPLLDMSPYTMAAASALIDLCREATIDVVHAHYVVPHAGSLAIARSALAPDRAPATVLTAHGTDVTRVGAHAGIRSATQHLLAQADALLVPSHYLAGRLEPLVPKGRPVDVVENFVDSDRYRPAPGGPDRSVFERYFPTRGAGELVAVHVSNLRPIKRVQDALTALMHLRGRTDARLVVIGEGPARWGLERQAEEMQMTQTVAFLGTRTREELMKLLPHADAFVFPSELESFGLAALEAMSCGVPVVGTEAGGLPEVVGDTGVLVPVGDHRALAEGLLEVAGRPGLRERARRRAIEHFSVDPLVERTLGIYRRVREMRRDDG